MSSRRSPGFKSAEEKKRFRHSLYKNTGTSWRDDLRKRCLDRLRLHRSKYIDLYRNIGHCGHASTEKDAMHHLLLKEWEEMQTEDSSLPDLHLQPKCHCKNSDQDDEFEFADSSDDVEYVLSIVEELTEELMKEEQRILSEHEQNSRVSEEALCAAIECLAANDVICPICQKNVLHQNKHIIFCTCGMRLDTAQDGITLKYIQKQLDDCCANHSASCCGKPVFTLEDTLGIQNIIMNCTTCDLMDIIV